MNQKNRRGFTFLEIMFVVVIIGVLMAVAVPSFVDKRGEADRVSTRQSLMATQSALAQFEMRVGRYPTTNEGLNALLERPTGISEDRWTSRFLMERPRDAWGNAFNYRQPGSNGQEYDLWSNGPDGIEGTEDDISAWRE